jgi:hypothetical protein
MAVLQTWSFEAGTLSYYADAGCVGDVQTMTTTTHKTIGGAGSAYSDRVFGGATRWLAPVGSTSGRRVCLWGCNIGTTTLADVTFYFRLGVDLQCAIRCAGSGFVSLYRGSTLVTTSVTRVQPWAVGHWWQFDVLAQNAGTITVHCDGVEIITSSTDYQDLASPDWDTLGYAASTDWIYVVDDVIISDDVGADTPEQICQILLPTANVSAALTPVPAGAGTNWDRVNAIPAALTEWCEGSVAGNEDVYTLANPAVSFATVLCATLWGWFARDGAITQGRVGVSSSSGGGTVYGAYTALPASPTRQVLWYVANTDPLDGAAWTSTRLNAAQIHVQIN